eukprot:403336312
MFFKTNSNTKASTNQHTPQTKEVSTKKQEVVSPFVIENPKQTAPIVQIVSTHKAKSAYIKGNKKSEAYEVTAIMEHKKSKNGRANEFKVQWAAHEPTWETEKTLRPLLDELLNQYMTENKLLLKSSQSSSQQAVLVVNEKDNKLSISPHKQEPTKLVEQQTKKSKSMPSTPAKKEKQKEPSNQSAKDKKQESKDIDETSAEQKKQDDKSNIQELQQPEEQKQPQKKQNLFEDIDQAQVSIIGNWKKLKRNENKDIYKCSECDQRIEVEKKGSFYEVNLMSNKKAHEPFDQIHINPFLDKTIPAEMMRLHSSCESFIKLQIKNKTKVSPDDILEQMKHQQPLIYKHFKPTLNKLAYYLMSLGKEINVDFESITPDVKRVTRSSRATPVTKFPEQQPVELTEHLSEIKKELKSNLKKREVKAEEKSASKDEKDSLKFVEQQLQVSLDELMELEESKNIDQDKQGKKTPSKSPKKKSKEQPVKTENLEKEQQQAGTLNVAKKRVQFNQVVTQAEFEKESEEQFSQQNSQVVDSQASQSQEESDIENSQELGLANYEGISSDEEEYESGNFLEYMKMENAKAMKERHYMIKQMKSGERRGSIFIDKVKNVVAAIQRCPGKFDYLVEWEFCKADNIVPSTSLVRGSHFVFSNPLQYRRYIEANFVENTKRQDAKIVMK